MNLRPISDAHKYQDSEIVPTLEVVEMTDHTQIKDEIEPDTEVYDEVIPCVYDEVDTKYDSMDFSNEPPAPPIRKRLPTNVVNTVPPTPIEEPNRPLPQTPSKRPSLISKFKSDKKEKVKAKKAIKDDATLGDNNTRPTSLFQRLFHRYRSLSIILFLGYFLHSMEKKVDFSLILI